MDPNNRSPVFGAVHIVVEIASIWEREFLELWCHGVYYPGRVGRYEKDNLFQRNIFRRGKKNERK